MAMVYHPCLLMCRKMATNCYLLVANVSRLPLLASPALAARESYELNLFQFSLQTSSRIFSLVQCYTIPTKANNVKLYYIIVMYPFQTIRWYLFFLTITWLLLRWFEMYIDIQRLFFKTEILIYFRLHLLWDKNKIKIGRFNTIVVFTYD